MVAPDLDLVGGVSRRWADRPFGDVVEATGPVPGGVVQGDLVAALDASRCDALVDYTSAAAVEEHVQLAIQHGARRHRLVRARRRAVRGDRPARARGRGRAIAET